MKYLKRFNESKIYNNINIDDVDKYYQVPFSIFSNEGLCLGDEDEYKLCFGNTNFYYDIIKDSQIEKYLDNNLDDINIDKGWERSKFEFANSDIEYHAKRIAKIIAEIKSGKKINPVSMFFDERAYEFAPNYIDDGNHRIRALKYLGYDYFPAYIYGSHAKYLIKYLSSTVNET